MNKIGLLTDVVGVIGLLCLATPAITTTTLTASYPDEDQSTCRVHISALGEWDTEYDGPSFIVSDTFCTKYRFEEGRNPRSRSTPIWERSPIRSGSQTHHA